MESAPDRARRARLKRLFNITPEEYDDVLIFQRNGCAICRRPPGKTRLAVDHDHQTGLIRGLVCWQCNSGLAKFRDSPMIVSGALDYLTTPPFTHVLGEQRFGQVGRVTTKKRRSRRTTKGGTK